jgi:hypothetical protein
LFQGRETASTLKKDFENLKKTLDKSPDLWYNKNVPREREVKRDFKRNSKTSKKVLDKSLKLWYNTNTRSRTDLNTRKGLILWLTRK